MSKPEDVPIALQIVSEFDVQGMMKDAGGTSRKAVAKHLAECINSLHARAIDAAVKAERGRLASGMTRIFFYRAIKSAKSRKFADIAKHLAETIPAKISNRSTS